MSIVTHTANIQIPIKDVWEVLDDFKNIYRWHYNAESSSLLSSNNEGLDATRKVRMYNGNEVTEKIVEYDKGTYMKADIIEHELPLKRAHLAFRLKEITKSSTEVTVEMGYVLKYGALGWILDKIFMKPTVRKGHYRLLNGLEQHILTGKVIGKDGNPIN